MATAESENPLRQDMMYSGVGEAAVHSELGLITFLMCVALVGAAVFAEILHGMIKRARDVVPNASITLIFGVLLGLTIEYIVSPYEYEHKGTHHGTDFARFNKEIFGFLLLPIIIFSSAFNMDNAARPAPLSFWFTKSVSARLTLLRHSASIPFK